MGIMFILKVIKFLFRDHVINRILHSWSFHMNFMTTHAKILVSYMASYEMTTPWVKIEFICLIKKLVWMVVSSN